MTMQYFEILSMTMRLHMTISLNETHNKGWVIIY